MRGTIPIQVTTENLVSSTVAEPFVPDAYDAGDTYAFGDIVLVAADFAIYESLQNTNLGRTPLSSPRWWRKIGVTETAYDDGDTYGLGATVYSAESHRCYESLQAANTGKPLPVLPAKKTEWWQDVGATRRYAMFDLESNSQTVGPSPLTAVVALNERANTLGLIGMSGNTLMVKATSVATGGIIYPLAYAETKTYAKDECMTVGLSQCYQSLADDNVGHSAPDVTWWAPVDGAIFDLTNRRAYTPTQYWFSKFLTRPSKTLFDIPLVTDANVTIRLTSASGNAKIGGAGLGVNTYLGKLLKPAKNVGRTFSTFARDLFGGATLTKRRMIPTLSGTLLLDSYLIDSVAAAREAFDATAVLYNGLEVDGDWTGVTTMVGVHQQFEIGMSPGEEALIPITIEGL